MTQPGEDQRDSVITWQVIISPSSHVRVTLLSFLFSVEFTVFMICFALILVMGNTLQPWTYWALAILLMILAIGLYLLAFIWTSLRQATGLMEFKVGLEGISFRNSLTGIQRWTIYFMMYDNYSELPALLTKPSTFIRWNEVRSVETDEDNLWIRVDIDPSSQPARFAIWPNLLLVCTPESFLDVRKAVEKVFRGQYLLGSS